VAAVVALALGSAGAWAQNAPASTTAAASADAGNELETVVVTSTRLQNAGFDAPTPTQVLNSEALEQIAQPNIFDAVVQLPALQGSTGTTYETGSTSTGLQGLSTLSLRGFSPIRTLTLFDGERVVGSNINQTVDVSQLPQMLIERVDVVTGGASASWGSDAVAGVVNFVTNKKFNGFKSDVSYGISNYGDNSTVTAKFAAGMPFMDGRAHFEIAGEYTKDDGVNAGGDPINHISCVAQDGRNWDDCSGAPEYSKASAIPAGQPAINYAPVVQGTVNAVHGIVTAGGLMGTLFGPNGQATPFNYAGGGVPTGSAVVGSNGGTCIQNAGCISNPSQPGDLSENCCNNAQETLVSPITRDTTYARLSFDVTPTSEVFATFNYGATTTLTEPSGAEGFNVNLPCNYAFLPGSITTGGAGLGSAAALAAGNLQQACYDNYGGTPSAGYPVGSMPVGVAITTGSFQLVDIYRQQRRFVLGGDGSFNVLGKDVTWDTYAEYGNSSSWISISNMPIKPNATAATDAIMGPNGTPVCVQSSANATGAANASLPGPAGCQPYNVFVGPGQNTAAADAYIDPAVGPYDVTYQHQVAWGSSFNVKPVKLWAGDLAVALGADYRLENYHSFADPYGNGTNATAASPADPYNALYPASGATAFTTSQATAAGGVWNAGNYHEGSGQYTVEEAFLETGIPLYKIPGWGSLDADLAGRFEHYNTNGSYYTWKMGIVWDTPLPGVRIRALQSADLRAPNLSEAFAAPTSVNGSWTNPFNGATGLATFQNSYGNPLLSPETSKTREVGVVFQPDYIRGFHASADWYSISVSNIIGNGISNTQQEVNNCYASTPAGGGNASLAQFCSQQYITTSNGINLGPNNTCIQGSGCTVTNINLYLANLATTRTNGIDFELAYNWNMNQWGIPGTFGIRGLATHVYGFINCPGSAGTFCTDYAGANGYYSNSTSYSAVGGTVPTWKTVFTEQYANAWGSLFLSQRWFNAGPFSNNDQVCTPGTCPAISAAQYSAYPTINYNHMPGALYWDAGVNLNFWGSKAEIYGKVNNLANLAPPPSLGGVNGTIYDVVGRMYYAGFRIHL
jgi:outer membrane receptor protein involved in Fe transport